MQIMLYPYARMIRCLYIIHTCPCRKTFCGFQQVQNCDFLSNPNQLLPTPATAYGKAPVMDGGTQA